MIERPTDTPRVSLLVLVQGLLERTYHMHSGIEDPGRFVIGDRGYRLFYAARRQAPARDVRSAQPLGAKTLVREGDDGTRACIYYPDRMIRQLERFPPQRGLREVNVDAFATLVEELDHLLLLAERSLADRSLTLFEMELHANVSKHLVLTRFLAGHRPRLGQARRRWLRHHLFEKVRYCEEDPAVSQRYRDAARWAVRLIDGLPELAPPSRIDTLRRFHRASTEGKIDLIRRVADRRLA